LGAALVWPSAGIEVDATMRTAVPSVYAAGDVVRRYLFTHSAADDAVGAVAHLVP